MKTTVERPLGKLQYFVKWHIETGTDYASAFAQSCAPYGDLHNLEELFDVYWKRYGGK